MTTYYYDKSYDLKQIQKSNNRILFEFGDLF